MRGIDRPRHILWMSLLGFLMYNVSTPAATLSANGKATARIVVARDEPKPVQYAARELSRYLKSVTGGEFTIQNRPEPGMANLHVGPEAAKYADPDFTTEGLGKEGIVLRSVGDHLILAGGNPRGTLYAIYTFLEDPVGCRFWAPGAETIPSRPTLRVEHLDVCYVPVLETRETTDFRATDGDWSVKAKLNGRKHRVGAHQGGRSINYIAQSKWSSHTFWTVIPPVVYFESHPEWFSLIDGKRVHKVPHYGGTSLCLTNEEMLREYIYNSKLALNWHPWATLYDISQIDDAGEPNRCMCGPCTAVEEQDNPSGLIIQFANKVIAELEKDFPEMMYSTLAYHYSQAPPKHTKPHEKLVVRLCSIGCSTSTPYFERRDENSDGDNSRHNKFQEDLLGWSKICDRLYVWDYVGNFTYLMLPHPNLRTQAPNIRFMVANNVKGIFGEYPSRNRPDTAMPELRSWMLAKLMWDPTLDDRALIEEFVHGYYGPAGSDVLAYVELIHDAVEESGDYLNLSSPPDAKFLSIGTLSEAWKILQDAEAAAGDHRTYRERVHNPQRSVLYAFSKAYDRLRNEAAETSSEWPLPDSPLAIHDLLHPPGPEVVYTLPAEWSFKTDPSDAGWSERWYEREMDTTWTPISVMKAWTDQGHDYHGAAWYRTSFRLPEAGGDDETLHLRFGAIDGDATVILDGEKLAEVQGHGWDQPVTLQLPTALNRDREHHLAVRVTKDNFAAGLWKPVRITR